ncbi:MAG: DUF3499 domain-containing protein [Nostocoides sp.]
MSLTRECSRSACRKTAVATLTYVYADQTAVVGPLATYAEPHTYDLCINHAEGLTAPRGWDIVRLAGDYSEPTPTPDDLLALADAVREAARPRPAVQPTAPAVVRGYAAGSGGDGVRGARGTNGAGAAAGPGSLGQAGGQAAEAAQPNGMREPRRRGHLRVLTDTDL